MKDLGEPNDYYGIEISRNKSKGILQLNQTKSKNKMLNKFGHGNSHGKRSPMFENQILNRHRRDREEEDVDKKVIDTPRYREVVGSLLYSANETRPDISYTVNILSRHQLNTTPNERKIIDGIFKYLIHTKDLSLTYRGRGKGIDGFSDSSLADCKASITTCGHCFSLHMSSRIYSNE